MSVYGTLIGKAIGSTDEATVALVEELMRGEVGPLDGLSAAGFVKLAQQSHRDIAELRGAGYLVSFCDAYGLQVPAA